MTIVKCPSCGAQVTWESQPHRPFCSEACKRRDLGKWATEEYAIPSDDGAGVPDGERGGEDEG